MTKRVHVWVSGARFDAARYMADNGIPFAFEVESSPEKVTRGLVNADFRDKLEHLPRVLLVRPK